MVACLLPWSVRGGITTQRMFWTFRRVEVRISLYGTREAWARELDRARNNDILAIKQSSDLHIKICCWRV